MRVTCLANTGAALLPATIKNGYPSASNFDDAITVGKSYAVVGMCIFQGTLAFVLSDDYGKPNGFPVELFRIVDPTLPSWWQFASFDEADGVSAIWGYPELFSKPYWSSLFARDASALQSFAREAERAEAGA